MVQSRFHGVFGPLLSGKPASVSVDDTDVRAQIVQEDDDVDAAEDLPSESPVAVVTRRAGGAVGQIAMDMYDEGDYIILRAPIAGVKLADLDIDVIGNKLTVSGSREQTDDFPSGKMYLEECFWGPFSRSVDLPFSPNPSRVKATFNKESILKIYIPKEKKVKIVRINEGG